MLSGCIWQAIWAARKVKRSEVNSSEGCVKEPSEDPELSKRLRRGTLQAHPRPAGLPTAVTRRLKRESCGLSALDFAQLDFARFCFNISLV